MKKISFLLLLILPLVLVVTALFLNDARGPYWLGTNLDPEYAYLLNGLNLANLKSVGHIDHPGTPVQVLGAVTMRVVYFFNFSAGDNFHTDVLKRPEYYLKAINIVMVILNASILLLLGFVTFKLTRNLWLSLWLQLAPFFSITILEFGLIRVTPEPLLLFSTLLLTLIIVIYAYSQPSQGITQGKNHKSTLLILIFALVTGFGIAVKITFLPILVIPILAFPGLKKKLLYAFAAVLSFILFTLPIIPMYNRFFDWIYRLFIHRGRYGGGSQKIISTPLYIKNIKYLLTGNPLFSFVLAVSLLVIITAVIIPGLRKRSFQNTKFKLLTAVALSQVIGVLMVAKHTSYRYLLPVLCLTGIAAFLIWGYFKDLLNNKTHLNYLAFSSISFVILAFIFVNPVMQIKKTVNNKSRIKEKSLALYQKTVTDYKDYAKIYYYASSSPQYALEFGNILSLGYHARALQHLYKDVYFFDIFRKQFFTYDYHQQIPFGKIQALHGNKIIIQGPKRFKIPGLNVKEVIVTNNFFEGIFIIAPTAIRAARQAVQWIETNVEKGAALVIPEEMAANISRLQNHYNVALGNFKHLDKTHFYTLALLMGNSYFLVPSSHYYDVKSSLIRRSIQRLDDFRKSLELVAVFPDEQAPEFFLGRIQIPGSNLSYDPPGKSQHPGFKEIFVWNPSAATRDEISPALYIQESYGTFNFDCKRIKERNVLIVSNSEPGKQGRRICRFGFSANTKDANLKIHQRKYIHFIAKVNIPTHLIDKGNYLFIIEDFNGKQEKIKAYFSGTGWLIYFISKKIYGKRTPLHFGFQFVPRSPEDKLMIEDIKVFVSGKHE